MSDPEDQLRRMFLSREPEAPNGDALLDAVQLRASRRRRLGFVAVPIAASALTAFVLVGVVTHGFGAWESHAITNVMPVASDTPTPSPRESLRAAKCAEPPFLWALGSGHYDFMGGLEEAMTVHVSHHVRLGGVDHFCQRQVRFDGQRTSSLLVAKHGVGTGSDRLTAAHEGTVEVVVLQPCPADAEQTNCEFLAVLGPITVTIEPEDPLPPVVGRCTQDDISVRAEGAAGTGEEMLWITVRLRGSVGCHLRGQSGIEIVDRTGTAIRMPRNPDKARVTSPLRPGKPVVIRWGWRAPFCGGDDPYSARIGILGVSARAEVGTPKCPTEYGGKRQDPAGIRFTDVTILR